MLAGNGCFGKYLCRIQKECTAQCHHCGGDQDSAQHTLKECAAWAEERRVLVQAVGGDLSLPRIVAKILQKEENWRAFSSFCDVITSRKEEVERERRGGATPSPPPRQGVGDRRGGAEARGARGQVGPGGPPFTPT